MMILVTGGSKSGKSKIAEEIVTCTELPRFYIATMIPFGCEAQSAIKRHRTMRANKGFVTIEKYTDICDIELPRPCAVLLECMGNLCANEMFSPCKTNPVGKILDEISLLVIVTNQVGEDGIIYPDDTMNYIKCLGQINSQIAQMADCVIETVFGIPLMLKGEMPHCI